MVANYLLVLIDSCEEDDGLSSLPDCRGVHQSGLTLSKLKVKFEEF